MVIRHAPAMHLDIRGYGIAVPGMSRAAPTASSIPDLLSCSMGLLLNGSGLEPIRPCSKVLYRGGTGTL